MPPKRKHTKTRTGCKTCRVRRIKCDEERPKCRNCTRRELECAYFNHIEPSTTAFQDLGLSDKGEGGSAAGGEGWPPRDEDRRGDEGTSSLSSCSPLPLAALPGIELEMKNLELLHHFTTTTYATLSMDEDIREMWRLAVPRIAFSNQFLMHALLAMSALHLSFLKSPDKSPEKSYAEVAARHHGEALGSLRTAYPALHPQHANALHAASSLTARYVYACPPAVDNMLPRATLWIPVFRGVATTIQRGWHWVRQGELAPLLLRKEVDRSRYAGEDTEFRSTLFDLSRRGASDELDPKELEDDHILAVYRTATDELKLSWDQFWSHDPREAAAFKWPCTMPDEFLYFLRERRPRALVILAHYCVMIELLAEEFWWARGRGVDEIERIEHVLEGKWKRWLDWPRAKCRISKGAG